MVTDEYRTPGQFIEALLKERGWSQQTLAIILGVNISSANRLVLGKKTIDAETAILLGEIFDVPAERFLELQKQYDLDKARMISRPDPGRTIRAHLFGKLPVVEMIRRGWLDGGDIRNVKQVEVALIKFFGVNSVDEIEILPHAAKRTSTFLPVSPAQMAWIYRVKEIASEMIVGRYSPATVRNAVNNFKKLLSAPEAASKVPRILAESGIRYVIVESLSSAKIDGCCFWLNDVSPVIGMSLRYDRIDNFWFVLRHEIEHVLYKHGRSSIMLDAELEGERAGTGSNVLEEERIANEAAADFCVPKKTMDSFIARKSPFFNERDILGLAKTLQIHPGLVAGQLQHRTDKYDRFRQHLVKIRYAVAPNAMVDGWGDIAPVG